MLGLAIFFPAIAFATVPNVYGIADFGNGVSNTMTITTDPGFATTEVSYALFNGETFNQSYSVQALNGASLVASQTLNSIAPNFNSGYGLVDIIALGGISRVTITPIGAPLIWDYLIDTVAFNQSILSIINPPPLPVVQPPTPPVHGHCHGHKKGEIELVEVNFGDDVNDIRGSVVVINAPIPEPSTWALMLGGCVATGFVAARRTRRAAGARAT